MKLTVDASIVIKWFVMVPRFDPDYAAGYGHHWRAGYKRVTSG